MNLNLLATNPHDDPTFQFGENMRTEADWKKAGPTDLFRLNAEIWAARHGIAGVASREGGVMLYWRKDELINACYFSHSKVINP